jgi:hypothetical protein
MSQRHLAAVLLRVLGVVCVIRAVDFVSTSVGVLVSSTLDTGFTRDTARMLFPLLTPLVPTLVLALILLRYAGGIAARMFPGQSLAIPEDVHPTDEWYVLALSVLGIVLLVWYLPWNIAQCLVHLVWPLSEMSDQLGRDRRFYGWNALLKIVMQLGLGMYLVLGARGIVGLLRKLRRE